MVIKTKYGTKVDKIKLLSYFDRLIGKIFKLLPIKESDEINFKLQHNCLMTELISADEFLVGGYYFELINKVNALPQFEHIKDTKSAFRKQIFECINCVESLRALIGSDADGESS